MCTRYQIHFCDQHFFPFPDFGGLFPDRDFSSGPLVVVAISQKTENDMTSWSSDVENEREDLTQLVCVGIRE